MMGGMVFSGGVVFWYYHTEIRSVRDTLERYVAECAKLRVVIASAEMTEEGRKVAKMTLAALNAAFPKEEPE
jgi:hypothetical protein